jgi:hypothetical protein
MSPVFPAFFLPAICICTAHAGRDNKMMKEAKAEIDKLKKNYLHGSPIL